ncbi:hypothetical protein SCH909_3138 [Serratia marcescens]|uniref:hypothetical protein n=1 Tax=Serratia marcescens TaxID=615 RepID=UPI0018A34A9B|nr:hypothetical protein [Serratia marcescens]QOU00318.1 hypothetical protein SCH909_3138 [Serratia marcescens]
MPTIIMDSCSYTRLGLTDYLTSHGVKKRHINAIEDIDSLHEKCSKLNPSLVFIIECDHPGCSKPRAKPYPAYEGPVKKTDRRRQSDPYSTNQDPDYNIQLGYEW